jgi:hypothetical protein
VTLREASTFSRSIFFREGIRCDCRMHKRREANPPLDDLPLQ